MELPSETLIPELKDSQAPLLLSIGDQKKLGLCIELGAEAPDYVFSRALNCLLKIAEVNGPSPLAITCGYVQ